MTGEDAISRQAAIDAVRFGVTHAIRINRYTGEKDDLFQESNAELEKAVERIADLPSVSTEKTGRWIDDEFGSKCSCCGIHTHLDKFDRPMKFKHCSMCGAKMGVEE